MKNYELYHVSSGKYADLPRAALEVLLLVHRSITEACEKWPLEPTYIHNSNCDKIKKVNRDNEKAKIVR